MYSLQTLKPAVTPTRMRNKPIGKLIVFMLFWIVSAIRMMPLAAIRVLITMLTVAVVLFIVFSICFR